MGGHEINGWLAGFFTLTVFVSYALGHANGRLHERRERLAKLRDGRRRG